MLSPFRRTRPDGRAARGSYTATLLAVTALLVSIGAVALAAGPSAPGRYAEAAYRKATGTVGPRGPKGEKGNKGAQGKQGATGATGATGPKGETGDIGPQGPQGLQGATGAQGGGGATGAKGDKGLKGDQGDIGNTGGKGDKGDKGDTGNTGGKGDKGDTGDAGISTALYAEGDVNIDANPGLVTAVAKHLTPGSYAIFGKLNIFNFSRDEGDPDCYLYMAGYNGPVDAADAKLDDSEYEVMTLQFAVNNYAGGDISIACQDPGSSDGVRMHDVKLTALKVGSVG